MQTTSTVKEVRDVFIVPRWAGAPDDDWYPWLAEQLESVAAEDGFNYRIHKLAMPAWDLPVIEHAVEYLQQVLPASSLNSKVILVGHSVGCLAILHYLASVAKPIQTRSKWAACCAWPAGFGGQPLAGHPELDGRPYLITKRRAASFRRIN